MQTNADMTIYLRHVVGRDESWHRTVIPDVAWSQHYFVVIPNAGLVASNSSMGYTGSEEFTVRVPYRTSVGTKLYVPPQLWLASDPEETFTFTENMWIVRGVVPEDIPFEEAIKYNKEACEVRSVRYNIDSRLSTLMQHWRLVG